MANNLAQLKKELKIGHKFKVIRHCRQECIGEIRRVTWVTPRGLYSVVHRQPRNKMSLANGGLGTFLGWGEVPFWSFRDGMCAIFSDKEHTPQNIIMEFRIL